MRNLFIIICLCITSYLYSQSVYIYDKNGNEIFFNNIDSVNFINIEENLSSTEIYSILTTFSKIVDFDTVSN